MNKSLWTLNTTFVLGALLDYLFRTALALHITHHYQDSGWMGLTPDQIVVFSMTMLVCPYLLFSGLAGKISDKLPQKRSVHVIKGAEILIMLLATIGFFTQSMTLLLLSLLLIGTQSTFMAPIAYDLIPKLVTAKSGTSDFHHQILEANSTIQTSYIVAIAVGTMLGSCMIQWFSLSMLCFSLLTVASIGWLSTFWLPGVAVNDSSVRLSWHPIKDNFELIADIKANKIIYRYIVLSGLFWFVYSTLTAILPVYGANALHGNLSVNTLLYVIVSVGVGIGSIWARTHTSSKENSIRWCFIIIVAALFCMAFFALVYSSMGFNLTISHFLGYASGWFIIGSFILFSLSSGLLNVILETRIQIYCEDAKRSRIVAAWCAFCAIAMVTSSLTVTLLIDRVFSSVHILAMLAGLTLLAVSYLFTKPQQVAA